MRRAIALALTSLWLAACGPDPRITASHQAKSPDGHWVAIVESRQWSGPGNAFDATQVELQQVGQRPFQILYFTHEYATMKVRLDWLSPEHLDVKFGPSDAECDHVDMTFQAIRAAGVEITTEPLSRSAKDVGC